MHGRDGAARSRRRRRVGTSDPSGEDVAEGRSWCRAGKRLGAPELGLLANAGFPTPLVHPRPRVIVLSTGDELIPPTETPEFGQVRDSNAYTIFGALREVGAMPCSPAS